MKTLIEFKIEIDYIIERICMQITHLQMIFLWFSFRFCNGHNIVSEERS